MFFARGFEAFGGFFDFLFEAGEAGLPVGPSGIPERAGEVGAGSGPEGLESF